MNKKMFLGFLTAVSLLFLNCGLSPKKQQEETVVETGKGKIFANQVKDAIENAGPFKVSTKVLKRGDEYDVRVELKTASRTDEDWNSMSSEEQYGYFMGVCAGATGILAAQSIDDFDFADLLIDYKGETWSIPINYCSYLASASMSGTMSDEDIGTKLLDKLEKVK